MKSGSVGGYPQSPVWRNEASKSWKMVKMCTYGSLWCIWILVLWAMTLASGQGSRTSTSATGQSDLENPTVRYAVTSLCTEKEYEFPPPTIISFTMIASPNG
ncbi:hypothetical protein RHMOL_Rhmol02G0275400 [Rhododendron molle]|uniref:Uncharacterized protein n=1 Tax=Rhododendron molle TaxID=49168 RepID=A0ACC0PXX1_RHOML|nr:hypothetical protein RHMOL_Rhmol02G0275400 [Rhododendron molle]